ncbi:MAG TPA: TolC family protein [Chryseolinea sp.]|nr:TolC family protein [Chryseolinea sp.]
MRYFVLVILYCAVTSSAFSQNAATEEPPQVKLTFEEAVKIGLEKNVLLNQAKNTLESTEAQKLNAIGTLTPSVNIGGNYQHQKGAQPNTTSGELEDLITDYAGLQLNANMMLFNGMGRLQNLRAANRQVDAQSYLVKRTSQDVIFNVATQYLQVLLDQELLKIAIENRNTQQTLLDKITATYEVGARAVTDVYTQDAMVKGLDVMAIRAKNTLQNDKSLLAQTLQLDPSQPFEAQLPTFSQDIAEFRTMPLDSMIKIALDNRADLKQAENQAKGNKYSMNAVAGRYLPSLSAYANYGSFYYSLIDDTFKNQFRTLNPSTTYGLNLTIPIYTGFQTRAQRAMARSVYQNSLLTSQNLEKTVALDVQRAYNNYVNAIQAYQSSLVQYQAGDLALQTQQESYLLGVSDQVAVANANQIYVLAAGSKAQAEVTLVFQKILLEYALGTLKFDQIKEN